jgi:Ca-activated chloride channel family protein
VERALNRPRLLIARGVTLLFGVTLLVGLFIVGPGCVHVAVAASFEKSELLDRIATDYNATRPSVDARCVRIDVFRKASGETERALAVGWHASDGPYPHAWSPAATTWVTLLERQRAERGLPPIVPPGLPPILRSPLVIAMPEPMARAMGWPAQNVTWAEIFSLAQDPRGWGRYGHSEWGAFRLAKTSPIVSTSGLHMLLATYEAAFQASGTRDPSDERVRAFVRGVESSVVHYGDTVSTFLKNLADADDRSDVFPYVSAIAMEEKQIWDYNNGNPEFRLTRTRQLPIIRLIALYPVEGTYFADHPFVVLNESWVDDRERRAATSFVDYLRSNAVQLRFQQDGFRGYAGEPGPIITGNSEFNANLPTRSFPSALPSALQQIQSSWTDLRKRARVVMVIDSSTSMGANATGSQSKLQLARQAALGALPSFAADDEIALWSFAAAPRELVALAPFRDQETTIRQEIEQLEAQGSRKALYATLTKAVERLSKGFDPARINAVLILTDGHNDDPENSDLSALIRLLRAQPSTEVVRVFTLGYGSGADLNTLERIAVASHGGAYEATDPRVIDRVFQLIVSNF